MTLPEAGSWIGATFFAENQVVLQFYNIYFYILSVLQYKFLHFISSTIYISTFYQFYNLPFLHSILSTTWFSTTWFSTTCLSTTWDHPTNAMMIFVWNMVIAFRKTGVNAMIAIICIFAEEKWDKIGDFDWN
jgi:hypothetical protein